jgi:uncharacterized protein (DUF1778 family)
MRTKKPMPFIAARVKQADLQLLRAAAVKRDQSQSEIMREALREKCSKILLATEQSPPVPEGA